MHCTTASRVCTCVWSHNPDVWSVLRKRSEALNLVKMTALDPSYSVYFCGNLHPPLVYINQHKALVVSPSYLVVITTNIPASKMTDKMKRRSSKELRSCFFSGISFHGSRTALWSVFVCANEQIIQTIRGLELLAVNSLVQMCSWPVR
jgi:hypothetical protein